MTEKHRHPEYRANARLVRQQVARTWKMGGDVYCWRCHRVIHPGAPYDVGHIDPDGGHARSNLAPEHRYRGVGCIGNRAAGGKLAHTTRPRRPGPQISRGSLPW